MRQIFKEMRVQINWVLKVRKRTDTITSEDGFQEEQLDIIRPSSSLFAVKLEP